jgi:hypothetical protein
VVVQADPTGTAAGGATATATATGAATARDIGHPLRNADPIIDCAPHGPELALEGTIVVRPFHKGTDGAILRTDTDEWIVSYRAEGDLLALDGQRVTARGHECAKGGQAMSGKHLDLDAVTPVSAAGRPRTLRTPGGRA